MLTPCDHCHDETRVPSDYRAGQRVLCDACQGAPIELAPDARELTVEEERRAEARLGAAREMRRDEAEWRMERGY